MRSASLTVSFVPAGYRALLGIFCLAAPLAAFDVPVPADESEARRMLDEGTLDSATWVRLEPFYNNPVCVPCGELDALGPLVPEHSADLPVSADALGRYAPWDAPSIDRFFDDYPWLREYRPVMTFVRTVGTWGTASARYYRSGIDNYTSKQTSFGLSPVRPVRITGRFDYGPEAATVEQRMASVDLGPSGSLAVGNCGPTIDDGLLLGHFPAYADDTADVLEQWRYGRGRSWNGAVWRLSGEGGSSVTLFGHDRPTERAAGMRSEFQVRRTLSVRLGGSFLSMVDRAPDPGPFYAAHAGITAALDPWKISAATCLVVHDGVRAPLTVSIEHRSPQAKVAAAVTWLPAGLVDPRSGVTAVLLDRIGVDADTSAVPASLVCVDWGVDGRIGGALRVHPFVSYLFLANGSGADGRAGLTASLDGPVDATLSYRYRPGGLSPAVSSDRHDAGFGLGRALGAHVYGSLTARYYARADGYQRVHGELSPAWSPDSTLKIAPLLSVYAGSMSSADYRWGLRSDVNLFPKVACTVRLEVPINAQNLGETIIDVRSAFCF